jgi:tRNA-splicing ligase RtcB
MELAGRYAYAGREWVVERVRRIVGGAVTDTVHVRALGMDRVGP